MSAPLTKITFFRFFILLTIAFITRLKARIRHLLIIAACTNLHFRCEYVIPVQCCSFDFNFFYLKKLQNYGIGFLLPGEVFMSPATSLNWWQQQRRPTRSKADILPVHTIKKSAYSKAFCMGLSLSVDPHYSSSSGIRPSLSPLTLTNHLYKTKKIGKISKSNC